MTAPITITVAVDSAAVEAHLGRIGPAVRARVRQAVKTQAIAVQRLTKEKLSGPVLKNRTGQLRRSINVRTEESAAGGIVAQIGTNVPYAHAHEYGFDGMEHVRAYVRRVKGRNVRAGGKVIAEGMTTVRAHDRHMHLPERSFLRSSLRERIPAIRAALQAAVEEGLRA